MRRDQHPSNPRVGSSNLSERATRRPYKTLYLLDFSSFGCEITGSRRRERKGIKDRTRPCSGTESPRISPRLIPGPRSCRRVG